jgi:hypothetical protein
MECSQDCPIFHSPPCCPLPPNDPPPLLTITLMPKKKRRTTPIAQLRPPSAAPPVRTLFGVNCPTHPHPPAAASSPALIHTPHQRPIPLALAPSACRCAGGGPVRSPHARRRGPAAAGGGRQRKGYNWTGGSSNSGWQGFSGPAGLAGGCGRWSAW